MLHIVQLQKVGSTFPASLVYYRYYYQCIILMFITDITVYGVQCVSVIPCESIERRAVPDRSDPADFVWDTFEF
jgi:hypothetical protein